MTTAPPPLDKPDPEKRKEETLARERAATDAGTTIDKWLRENPEASPDEAVCEFVRRYVHNLRSRV